MALVRIDVSGECITCIIRVSSLILFTMMMKVIYSCKTSVLITNTWHHIPEDDILHSHSHGNLKSYTAYYASHIIFFL
jgi:hypothetical protein